MEVPETCITTIDAALAVLAVRLALGLAVHNTAVADAQDDDEQLSTPTNAVGEAEYRPKLKPATDSPVSPDAAQFFPTTEDSTGAARAGHGATP